MTEVAFILSIAQFVLVLAASVWAYFRVWKEGIYRPKIEFTVECSSYGPKDDHYIVEFLVIVHNKGLINQKFYSIFLRVRGIGDNDEVSFWEGNEPRIKFPTKFFETEFIFKQKYSYVFVEPGVKQVMSYVTKIPVTHSLLLVRAEFQYENAKSHSIERLVKLKTDN